MDTKKYHQIIKISNEDISKYINTKNLKIYHYTSPIGLNGILTNHTLRFTDRNFLNDYSEGRYVLQLCLSSRFELKLPKEYRTYFKEYCKELWANPTKKQRYVYQCSFSIDKDNLSLWNYYTKSDGIKGYNIGFYSNDLEKQLETAPLIIPREHGIKIFCGQIVYSEKKQKEIIKSIVQDFTLVIEKYISDKEFCKIAIQILIEKILQVGAFFKKSCFKHENEYRLLLFLTAIWDESSESIKFMVLNKNASTYEKNGLLVPYVDIKFPSQILQDITISPTIIWEEAKGNLLNALKLHSYNYKTISINKSDIPVRY